MSIGGLAESCNQLRQVALRDLAKARHWELFNEFEPFGQLELGDALAQQEGRSQ